jgi:hypothetical protein
MRTASTVCCVAGLHVDGGPRRCSARDAAGPARRRHARVRCVADAGPNPWAAIPGMTLVERGHMPPPEPGAPGIFAMGLADRIVELVTGAGSVSLGLRSSQWRLTS